MLILMTQTLPACIVQNGIPDVDKSGIIEALGKNVSSLTVGGLMFRLFGIVLPGRLIKLFTGKKLNVINLQPNNYLNRITEPIEKGQIKPVFDGSYEFNKISKPIKYSVRHLTKERLS